MDQSPPPVTAGGFFFAGRDGMDGQLVRRITPLTVREDISGDVRSWLRLGCGQNGTGDDGNFIGITTGSTHWLLVSRKSMEADFGAEATAPLVGRTIPYVYVRSIEAALALWPDAGQIRWGDTEYAGTRELLITHHGETLILAETPNR
jgi:hypothetical protein